MPTIRKAKVAAQSSKDRQCLLCSSSRLASCYEPAENISVTSDFRIWPAPSVRIICEDCGHLQKPRGPASRKQTAEVYSGYDLYRLSGGAEQQKLFGAASASRSGVILDRLTETSSIAKSGRMLDFGCSSGVTLRAFAERFPGWSLFGYEQDDRCETEIRKISGVKGFFSGDIARAKGPFDLISLIHVFEHVDDPIDCLSKLRALLSPQGILLIQVPNILENPFDMAVIDHYSQFSPQVLSAFVARQKFKVSTCAADWIAKEISLVARKANSPQTKKNGLYPLTELKSRLRSEADWLKALPEKINHLAGNKSFCIFGTTVAGSWLGGLFDRQVTCFVDEQAEKVGKTHLGRPVVHPRNLKSSDHVLLAFPPALAEKIRDRLTKDCAATIWIPPN